MFISHRQFNEGKMTSFERAALAWKETFPPCFNAAWEEQRP
jgi:hypothetical protein